MTHAAAARSQHSHRQEADTHSDVAQPDVATRATAVKESKGQDDGRQDYNNWQLDSAEWGEIATDLDLAHVDAENATSEYTLLLQ